MFAALGDDLIINVNQIVTMEINTDELHLEMADGKTHTITFVIDENVSIVANLIKEAINFAGDGAHREIPNASQVRELTAGLTVTTLPAS
jgi:hypothetical protein